jgi:hypothetical protein
MATGRQIFTNRKDGPIYISIEPNPDCYELEPGESLTVIYDLPPNGEALSVEFINDRELVIWPLGDQPAVLIDGASAEGRSWKFKHHPG